MPYAVNSPDSLDIRTSLARLAAPSLGLLVFAAMILRGLAAGNPAQTVLVRALWGLGAGVVLGGLAGSVAQLVLGDPSRSAGAPVSPTSDGREANGGVAATGA